MFNLRKLLRFWLGIEQLERDLPPPLKIPTAEEVARIASDAAQEAIENYKGALWPVSCLTCKNIIQVRLGGYYTDSHGHIMCSNACVDKKPCNY